MLYLILALVAVGYFAAVWEYGRRWRVKIMRRVDDIVKSRDFWQGYAHKCYVWGWRDCRKGAMKTLDLVGFAGSASHVETFVTEKPEIPWTLK